MQYTFSLQPQIFDIFNRFISSYTVVSLPVRVCVCFFFTLQRTCWSMLTSHISHFSHCLLLCHPQGVYLQSAEGNWKADGIPLVSEAEVRVSVWLRGLPLSGRGSCLSHHPAVNLSRSPLLSNRTHTQSKQTSSAWSSPPQSYQFPGCLIHSDALENLNQS